MQSFKVIRSHVGDKSYSPGDIRQADMNEVKHLVPHVLVPSEGAKAELAVENKIAHVPENKSQPTHTIKGKRR